MVHLELRISSQIFETVLNGANWITPGPVKMKKPVVKTLVTHYLSNAADRVWQRNGDACKAKIVKFKINQIMFAA